MGSRAKNITGYSDAQIMEMKAYDVWATRHWNTMFKGSGFTLEEPTTDSEIIKRYEEEWQQDQKIINYASRSKKNFFARLFLKVKNQLATLTG